MKTCPGWPEGHACAVTIPDGRIWCRGCVERRQAAYGEGIDSGAPVAAGIILEDFQAPRLQCVCGGDAEGPDHVHSLLHMRWSWGQSSQLRA